MTFKTDYFQKRLGALDKERVSFIGHYGELSDFVQPRRGRFFVENRNRGHKVHNNIINSRAGQALQIARSGMLAGTMSPSRPWFDMETPDPGMMEIQSVKEWVAQTVRSMQVILNRGNFYGQASVMLQELLLFGTGCVLHVDDFLDVARFYAQTVGEYYIAQNNRLEVDTIVREFQWTVAQIVGEFGLDNVSTEIKKQYDLGNYDSWFTICQFIEPNLDSVSRPDLPTDKAYSSVWFEKGKNKKDLLRVSGFDEFPAYCPRWETTSSDIYGTDCPGMTALGDVKALQSEEREKAKAIEKMVSPPMSGPPSLENTPVSQLPGGLTIYSANGAQALTPLYQVTAPIAEMRADMAEIEARINSAFFVDLFLAITAQAGVQPRNELEILSKNEERLLQLGPVLERLHGEFLEPMLNRLFNQMVDRELVPPVPPELENVDLRIKFISNLAIAQRAVVTGDLDRILGAVTNVAQINPNVVKKLDEMQYVDEYARAIGVPPKVIKPDDVVAAEVAEEQRQLMAQQAVQTAVDATKALQQAGSVQTGPDKGENLVTGGELGGQGDT
jgi:hypothetical protein